MNTPVELEFTSPTVFKVNWNKQASDLHRKPQLQLHINHNQYTVDNIELYVDSRGQTTADETGKKNWYLTGICTRVQIHNNIAILT